MGINIGVILYCRTVINQLVIDTLIRKISFALVILQVKILNRIRQHIILIYVIR